MYKLRLNVIHDGVSLKAGDACPEEYVKPLLEQGLLEKGEGNPPAPNAPKASVDAEKAPEEKKAGKPHADKKAG